MKTYKIIRFHFDDNVPDDVIVRGLTLKQARAHCRREDSHGDGWFDGFTDDEEGDSE